jgi:hypothetical protein
MARMWGYRREHAEELRAALIAAAAGRAPLPFWRHALSRTRASVGDERDHRREDSPSRSSSFSCTVGCPNT